MLFTRGGDKKPPGCMRSAIRRAFPLAGAKRPKNIRIVSESDKNFVADAGANSKKFT